MDWKNINLLMLFRPYSGVKSFETKYGDKMAPISPLTALANAIKLVIMILSDGLNQTAENLAGQLTIKMFPIALKALPIITKTKL